jgi:plasmid stabilization system protein ParE
MAGKQIIWSKKASEELFKILEYYIERNGNANFSKKLKKRIDHTLKLIQYQEKLGKKTDNDNIRCITELDYQIFYEIQQESINVLVFWDSQQNPDKLKKRIKDF